jgi:hypothetical protein
LTVNVTNIPAAGVTIAVSAKPETRLQPRHFILKRSVQPLHRMILSLLKHHLVLPQ